MRRKRTSWILTLTFLGVIGLGLGAARAEEKLTARQIMDKVDARDDGDRAIADMEMILIDKNGKERVRQMRSFGMDKGEDDYSLMFFLSPADVKNTGFLTYDYDDEAKDDDQWLYLPALKKTKRIASSNKSDSFMGSDFTYADMTKRNLDYYEYKLMEEKEVDGHKVWQIESIPTNPKEIEETGYTKSIVFVRQDIFVVVRAVSWVKKGDRLKYMDTKDWKQIDGIWVAGEVTMVTKKGSEVLHKTILRNSNMKFNQEMTEDLFTTRQLEKGL